MLSEYANGLVISPDNAFAYAVSSGYIVKIDTSTDMIINTLPLPNYFPKNYFPFPNLLAITPDGKTLYLSNSYARAFGGLANPIYAIDAASLTVIASIPNSFSTEAVVIRPDGAFAYILSQQAALVYVINTTTNTISSTISVTGAGSEMAISPEGSQIYVTAFQDNRFYIIDTSTQSISATITSANFNQPASPAPTPDGSFVYVCNVVPSNTVCQVNPITEAVSLPIPLGVNPRYITIVQPVHVSGLTGSQKLNRYASQTETYNLLTWNLPTAGVIPVSYRIYRDAALTTLAGTSDTFSFIDHNLNPGQTYDYYVVSVAYNGDTSLSAHVTVSPL
jgi:YVTN family beta-propeller protein